MLNRIATVAALAVGGYMLSKQFNKSRYTGAMSSFKDSIEVEVPVSTAYNQWTQFEDFPKFMDGVREVRQLDDTHTHWRADVAGQEQEWESEIVEQIPDKRIAWRSTSGLKNAGAVNFLRISDGRTRVTLQMEHDPQSFMEEIGDATGLIKMRVKSNLRDFKSFVEGRGAETGAWRGTVKQGAVTQH